MITSISIEGFKCIDKLSINFSKLNLLLGTNSAGKSTIIQSILIASQNISDINSGFNGSLISPGDFREVRNFIKNSNSIFFKINDNFGSHTWCFTENATMVGNVVAEECELNFDQQLFYLPASRIGNMDIYEKNIKEIFKFGLQGEYCLSYFEKHKTLILPDSLLYDDVSKTLEHNVNYWLNYIVEGKLLTTNIQQTDKIKALFRGKSGREVRTKNIGSGLSYLISIIIVCLSAKPGNTIIIENPEIHLHPKAQSRLTEFFSFISNANIQLIIETHSDHIFNGIRVAKVQGRLKDIDISINFLELNDKNCSVNHNIVIGKRGRILDCPNDLFDQFEIDLDRMLGI